MDRYLIHPSDATHATDDAIWIPFGRLCAQLGQSERGAQASLFRAHEREQLSRADAFTSGWPQWVDHGSFSLTCHQNRDETNMKAKTSLLDLCLLPFSDEGGDARGRRFRSRTGMTQFRHHFPCVSVTLGWEFGGLCDKEHTGTGVL